MRLESWQEGHCGGLNLSVLRFWGNFKHSESKMIRIVLGVLTMMVGWKINWKGSPVDFPSGVRSELEMRLENHNSQMVIETEGWKLQGQQRGGGKMNCWGEPRLGNEWKERLPERRLKASVEVRKPEKQSVLEAKTEEFQDREFVHHLLCCRSGSCYFCFTGSRLKPGDGMTHLTPQGWFVSKAE